MKYSVVDKEVRHRWQEVLLKPEEFFEVYKELFEDEDSEFSLYDYYPELQFENGSMNPDEMWGVRDGHLWTSSYQGGLLNYEEGQYVRSYYGSQTKLGQLVSVSFTLDEKLTKALNND